MRNALVMGSVGATLFASTIVGLLAMQGRLDPEQPMMVVERVVDEPAGEDDDAAFHAAPAVETDGATPGSPQDSAFVSADDPESRLFTFPPLPSGLSVAEINELVTSARRLREELDRRAVALDQREADLSVRESDLVERERAVLAKMREVLQQRAVLEAQIESFERADMPVPEGEVGPIHRYAAVLTTLSGDKAAEIVRQLWRTPEGRRRVIRVLEMMPVDARDGILFELDAATTREILDLMTGVENEEGG